MTLGLGSQVQTYNITPHPPTRIKAHHRPANNAKQTLDAQDNRNKDEKHAQRT